MVKAQGEDQARRRKEQKKDATHHDHDGFVHDVVTDETKFSATTSRPLLTANLIVLSLAPSKFFRV